MTLFEKYDEVLRAKLDDYRYRHSLGVAKSAVQLAKRFGADAEKAECAGLLHDIMKNATHDEQLQILEKADIIIYPCERLRPMLLHAPAGAAFIKAELKIDDEEIISAVRWHSTGKAGMTLLEKTVYLADFISEDRTYPDVDDLRRIARESLDSAVLYAQRYCIGKLLSDGAVIDVHSVECYNELVQAAQ